MSLAQAPPVLVSAIMSFSGELGISACRERSVVPSRRESTASLGEIHGFLVQLVHRQVGSPDRCTVHGKVAGMRLVLGSVLPVPIGSRAAHGTGGRTPSACPTGLEQARQSAPRSGTTKIRAKPAVG